MEMVVLEKERQSISGVEMSAGDGPGDGTDEEQSYSGPPVYTEYPSTPETSTDSDGSAESDEQEVVD